VPESAKVGALSFSGTGGLLQPLVFWLDTFQSATAPAIPATELLSVTVIVPVPEFGAASSHCSTLNVPALLFLWLMGFWLVPWGKV
jgi:hypothetical protein